MIYGSMATQAALELSSCDIADVIEDRHSDTIEMRVGGNRIRVSDAASAPARPPRQSDLQAQVERDVARLMPLGLEGLRDVWRERYGDPPKLRSPQLLRLDLAWRIQANAFGGLEGDTRRRLRRGGAGASAADCLQPGVRLSREWKGVPHEVIVEEGGFRYGDQSWASLSQIARHISGARWNGPRFFGLRPDMARAKAA